MYWRESFAGRQASRRPLSIAMNSSYVPSLRTNKGRRLSLPAPSRRRRELGSFSAIRSPRHSSFLLLRSSLWDQVCLTGFICLTIRFQTVSFQVADRPLIGVYCLPSTEV